MLPTSPEFFQADAISLTSAVDGTPWTRAAQVLEDNSGRANLVVGHAALSDSVNGDVSRFGYFWMELFACTWWDVFVCFCITICLLTMLFVCVFVFQIVQRCATHCFVLNFVAFHPFKNMCHSQLQQFRRSVWATGCRSLWSMEVCNLPFDGPSKNTIKHHKTTNRAPALRRTVSCRPWQKEV